MVKRRDEKVENCARCGTRISRKENERNKGICNRCAKQVGQKK